MGDKPTIRLTAGQLDDETAAAASANRDNQEHIEKLTELLVGETLMQVGQDTGGCIVLEFQNHLLVISGGFFVAGRDQVITRPPPAG